MSPSLAGKCIVVSGAASGIGKAVARHVASLGANVSLADINYDGLIAEADRIRESTGVTCLAHCVDVRKSADVDGWIRAAVDTFGRVDGAVNCAGVFSTTGDSDPIASKSDAEWDAVVDINLTG
ncbi:NAD(P)-binding protein, partial [Periconia macrospinosa]